MKVSVRHFGLASVAVLTMLQQTTAVAQSIYWTIVYAPVSTSVPTLSEWGMIALSVMLAGLAVYTFRTKSGGKPLASIFFVLALTLGSFSSNKIIQDANAYAPPTMTNPAGGTVTAPNIAVEFEVINGTSVPLQIISISPTSTQTVGHSPTCVVGTVVQPAGMCWIWNGQTPG